MQPRISADGVSQDLDAFPVVPRNFPFAFHRGDLAECGGGTNTKSVSLLGRLLQLGALRRSSRTVGRRGRELSRNYAVESQNPAPRVQEKEASHGIVSAVGGCFSNLHCRCLSGVSSGF